MGKLSKVPPLAICDTDQKVKESLVIFDGAVVRDARLDRGHWFEEEMAHCECPRYDAIQGLELDLCEDEKIKAQMFFSIECRKCKVGTLVPEVPPSDKVRLKCASPKSNDQRLDEQSISSSLAIQSHRLHYCDVSIFIALSIPCRDPKWPRVTQRWLILARQLPPAQLDRSVNTGLREVIHVHVI